MYRVYQLETLPLGFFTDEANIGVIAQSVLKTGRDDYGVFLPMFFEGFGDYRLPIAVYLQIPFIGLLGLHVFTVRFTTVLLSTVSILLSYKIGKQWLNEKFGLLCAFFLAINPWYIHLSRNAMEWSYPVFFTFAAIYFFTKGIYKKIYIVIGSATMALALYTYYSAIIVVPLLFFIIFLYFVIRKKQYKAASIGLGIFFLLSVPLLIGFFQGKVGTRFTTIIKNDPSRKVHITSQMPLMVKSYFNHFDIDFLFFNSKKREDITRHSIKNIGQIAPYGIVLLPLAILFLSHHFLKKEYRGFSYIVVTSLLVLFPLPGIANEGQKAMATRAVFGIIPFNFLYAFGAYYLLTLISKIKWKGISILIYCLFSIIVCVDMMHFTFEYFQRYRVYASDYMGWQYGFEPTMHYFKKKENEYDELLITHRFNMGPALLSFYNQTYKCTRCTVFPNPIEINPSKKQLFAVRPDDITEAKERYPYLMFKTMDVIRLPNNRVELYIGEFVPVN